MVTIYLDYTGERGQENVMYIMEHCLLEDMGYIAKVAGLECQGPM